MGETGVAALFGLPPYGLPEREKAEMLLPIIKQGVGRARSNPHLSSMMDKLGVRGEEISSLEEVPFVPVRMFKEFDLGTVPQESITRVLRSSGTTAQVTSRIPIDKETAGNQTKALKSILSSYLGEKRRVLLVLDHAGINAPGKELTARGAGVRGLSIYAKQVIYLMKEEDGRMALDEEAVAQARALEGQPIFVFGFTYIIWSTFLPAFEALGRPFGFPGAVVFHGGGWKRLNDEKVTNQVFSRRVGSALSTSAENVHDFYGMAEQTGVIFVECPLGHKHVPIYGQVIARNPRTLEECRKGERGLLEVMSALGESYYSQAILTEDVGRVLGEDDCPCGRKGRYFQVEGRAEKAESRGCGDTFRPR